MTDTETMMITELVAEQLREFAQQQEDERATLRRMVSAATAKGGSDPNQIKALADSVVGAVQSYVDRTANARLGPILERLAALEQR